MAICLPGMASRVKAGGDFRHPAGALGDDHEVDDDQDDKDHHPDHVVAADDKLPKGLDDMAGGRRSLVAVHEDEAGRGDVEGEAEHGGDQQERWKDGEVGGLDRIEAEDEDEQGDGDAHGEKEIKHQRRQGNDHHQKNGDQADGCHYISAAKQLLVIVVGQGVLDGGQFHQRSLPFSE
jgi:hypothetical protein